MGRASIGNAFDPPPQRRPVPASRMAQDPDSDWVVVNGPHVVGSITVQGGPLKLFRAILGACRADAFAKRREDVRPRQLSSRAYCGRRKARRALVPALYCAIAAAPAKPIPASARRPPRLVKGRSFAFSACR